MTMGKRGTFRSLTDHWSSIPRQRRPKIKGNRVKILVMELGPERLHSFMEIWAPPDKAALSGGVNKKRFHVTLPKRPYYATGREN